MRELATRERLAGLPHGVEAYLLPGGLHPLLLRRRQRVVVVVAQAQLQQSGELLDRLCRALRRVHRQARLVQEVQGCLAVLLSVV
jgi:hypothetical protein